MRYLLFPLLVLCCTVLACKKNKNASKPSVTSADSVTIPCNEQHVGLKFRYYTSQMTKQVLLISYLHNGGFNKPLETYVLDRDSLEYNPDNLHYTRIHKGCDYEIIVPGIDTFRITDIINTPTEQVFTGRHAYLNHCFYYDKVVMDGDTVTPQSGQYISTLYLFKK